MTNDQFKQQNYLDNLLEQEGEEACSAAFIDLCHTGRQEAIAALEDETLTFPCFFLLIPQIKEWGFLSQLSPRAAATVTIVDNLLDDKAILKKAALTKQETLHDAFRWILFTGWDQDHSPALRMILDAAASTLLHTYGDRDALKPVCDMIIRRGLQGYNTHYLVWAYFHTHDPAALRLMAEYLRAEDSEWRQLAAQILRAEGKETAYHQWLTENDAFLYFSDESPQLCGNPEVCKVDHARKYLNKRSGSYEKQEVVPADSGEENALAAFAACDADGKEALASHSQILYARDPRLWSIWLQSPVEQQLKEAKAAKEGTR